MARAKKRIRLVTAVDEVTFKRGLFRIEMGGNKNPRRYALTPMATYRLFQLLHDEINRAGEVRKLELKEGA